MFFHSFKRTGIKQRFNVTKQQKTALAKKKKKQDTQINYLLETNLNYYFLYFNYFITQL